MTFKELQELVVTTDVYVFYGNDYWKLRRYPMGMELTPEQDENCVIVHSDDVDPSTFPQHQLYDYNCYGNGLFVLLANTPNHRVKGVEAA